MAMTPNSHDEVGTGSRGAAQSMTEQIGVKRHRHPHGPAKTGAKAIRRRQREADVLTYRLHGHSYAAIGKQLNIPPQTAYDYCVRALQRIVPIEDARQVLRMELARLDTLEAALFSSAANGGDIPAVDACLRIQAQRCRLLNLFPNEKGGINVNIGANPAGSAEDTGIQVTFVHATKWGDGKLIEHMPVMNGNGGSK
jgi:hypothetical protein